MNKVIIAFIAVVLTLGVFAQDGDSTTEHRVEHDKAQLPVTNVSVNEARRREWR